MSFMNLISDIRLSEAVTLSLWYLWTFQEVQRQKRIFQEQ